jgi:hypothetical protein
MVARKPTDVVQVNLRLRESLRRRLEREAERRGLSFNAELIRRLRESFDREDLEATILKVLTDAGLVTRPPLPDLSAFGALGITKPENKS